MTHAAQRGGLALLAAPVLVLLAACFVYPLLHFVLLGADHDFLAWRTLAGGDALYLAVFWLTLRIAFATAALCLVLGYPLAYFLATAAEPWRSIVFAFVLLPFWTSLLVRTYAWIALLGRNGVINRALIDLGLIERPLPLLYNFGGVLIGIVHVLLPYMVFPVYAALARIDPGMALAAEGLGARGGAVFRRILLPLSANGIFAGAALVFTLSLGAFVTPALLGGGRIIMIANLIQQEVSQFIDWPLASALAVVLTAAALAIYGGGRSFRGARDVALAAGGRTARRRGGRARLALRVYVAAVCVFLMAPLFIVFPLSLSAASYLQFPPPGLSLQWFAKFFGSESWMAATVRSVEIASATALLALALGVPFAFHLARTRRRLVAAALDRLALLPLVVPTIVTAVALYGVFAPLRLIGTWYALVLAHTVIALPFVTVVVAAALGNFDMTLEQAAQGLGAGRAGAVFHVTLPQIRASLIAGGFFAFMASFDDLVIALFLSGSNMTLPRKTFEDIMYAIDPTIAAVSVLQILFVAAAGLVWYAVRRAARAHDRAAAA